MSEIAERINYNARRSSEYADGVILSDASIDQIIQAESGYEEEIATLESRIEELGRFVSETLEELVDCPHNVYGWNHQKHNCKECDSMNTDYCFCWELWIKEKLNSRQSYIQKVDITERSEKSI
jgi:hypothetical protein